MEHEPFDPRCDKCGAPVTTSAMALICPRGKQCEFWVPEIETFKALFQDDATATDSK
jgi:Zn finger protein HypA/HybF involved in hydrogenase expression